jgi:hypothetical protein
MDDWVKFKKLVVSVEAAGMHPYDLILGPTDILTSANREEVMNDFRMVDLLQHFKFLSITCGFLSTDLQEYEWLARQLNVIMPGKGLTLTIPIKVGYLNNPKYTQGIRDRLKYFTDQLIDITLNEVVTTVVYDEQEVYKISTQEHVNLDMITQSLGVHFGRKKDIDFVIHHGREGFANLLNRDRFLRSARSLALVTRDAKESLPEYGIKETNDMVPHEGRDTTVIYNNGRLYHRPFLMEHLPYFDPIFEVKGEWVANTLIEERSEQLVEGLTFAVEHPLCKGCPAMTLCADRGVHAIMKHLGAQECITDLNQSLEGISWT